MKSAQRVVVVSRAPRGGHPRYCAELARALHDEGAQVAIAQPAQAFLETTSLLDGVPVERVRLPDVSSGWLRQEAAIVSFLRRRGGPGIVLFEETSPLRAVTLLLLKKQTSWSFATMVHNTRPHGAGLLDRLRHEVGLAALAVPHRVLVHNDSQRHEVESFWQNRSTAIDVVPHGPWTRDIVAAAPKSADRVARLLMFGVMRENSGLEALGELADQLATRGDVVISVMGKPTSDVVAAQLGALSARPNVEVTAEFIPDDALPALFAEHDYMILPYESYTSESGVLMEAISRGLPVITAGDSSIAQRVAEHGLGPAPTGSLVDQTKVALAATQAQRSQWQRNLADARVQSSWTRQAQILLGKG